MLRTPTKETRTTPRVWKNAADKLHGSSAKNELARRNTQGPLSTEVLRFTAEEKKKVRTAVSGIIEVSPEAEENVKDLSTERPRDKGRRFANNCFFLGHQDGIHDCQKTEFQSRVAPKIMHHLLW